METARPTPALPPPPGRVSNFGNPESLRRQLDIGAAIAIALSTLFVILRSYSRIWLKKTWILEDWTLLLAWASVIVQCGLGEATMVHYGGRHEWDITTEQGNEAAYWFNVASILYGLGLFFAKITVLQLYRRVFSPHRGSAFDNGIIVTALVIFLFHLTSIIIKIFECTPRAKIYNMELKGSCIDISVFLTASGSFNTISDIVILVLPVKAVWSLNMASRKKVVVILVFTFGLAAPAFSLYGFVVRLKGLNNSDKNWNQPAIVMWGLLETTTAVLCASFPECGPIFLRRKKTRSHPSTSILNGRHSYYGGRSGPPKKGILSTITGTLMMTGRGAEASANYYDLETYGVQAAAQHPSIDAQTGTGAMSVMKEVGMASKSNAAAGEGPSQSSAARGDNKV
ncbi:hypothetical protein F5Y17DRAFT_255489 [Xylariaceae sp. FL0594]|nr:hypothetical protein F5Y17DRAFT_255489 [Xylariaceae sp. FL0594]